MKGETHRVRLVVVLLAMLVLSPMLADSPESSPSLQVKVAEPYVEIRTGPGRGYPVFHVVERHAPLTLLFQRAGWIKVETPRGRIGWVPRKALLQTLDGSGETPELQHLGHEDFTGGHWQASVLAGELDGVTSLAVGLGYRFTENLTAEAMFTQASGNFSNNKLMELNLQHQLFPRWRVSPYTMLGTGRASIEPRATLVR